MVAQIHSVMVKFSGRFCGIFIVFIVYRGNAAKWWRRKRAQIRSIADLDIVRAEADSVVYYETLVFVGWLEPTAKHNDQLSELRRIERLNRERDSLFRNLLLNPTLLS